MKKLISHLIYVLAMVALTSCNNNEKNFDASGSFEAEEVIISSQATGIIKQLSIEEGNILEQGQYIGYVDSLQLYLKRKQLVAQMQALLTRKPNISVQLAALQEQLKAAEIERNRILNLLEEDAATTKQLDDINANIDVIKKQISAQKSNLVISSESINKDANTLDVQIEQLNDQLEKCKIINPISGTVLTKYAEENEITSQGKPLYKIADLTTIILRVYITGDQLSMVKLNQKVKVHTDDGNGKFKETEGVITWISDKAEFTPKTVQTKNERANRVYAIKINVENDGYYKIGMYGEINFE